MRLFLLVCGLTSSVFLIVATSSVFLPVASAQDLATIEHPGSKVISGEGSSATILVATSPISSEFSVPESLAGRVEFWKLIFSKYGRYQKVFHHRAYPEIIYSVLDFETLASEVGPSELARTIAAEESREASRIERTLAHLGNGNPPRDSFEKRVERLFKVIPERGFAKYREALEKKMIRSQTGIRDKFRASLVRSGRYLYAIEEVFRLAGLPTELARIPYIESSFDYTAYSSVGAAGIWQFMRGTGKRYMRITAALDERRDPIIASRAAAQYLQNAYDDLEAWPLAITSYNHGVSGMLRATRETGSKDMATIIRDYKGSSFGFASGNFYPEFLAALYIDKNAERYFPGLQREAPWYFDEVKLERATSYRDVLRHSGCSAEDFERLNRGVMAAVVDGRAALPVGYMLKVPEGSAKKLIAGLGHGEFHSLHSSHDSYVKTLRENKYLTPPDKKPSASSKVGKKSKKTVIKQAPKAKKSKTKTAVITKKNQK